MKTTTPLPAWALTTEPHPTDSAWVLAPFNLAAAKAGVPVRHSEGRELSFVAADDHGTTICTKDVSGYINVHGHRDLHLLLPAPPEGWALVADTKDVIASDILHAEHGEFRIYRRKLSASETQTTNHADTCPVCRTAKEHGVTSSSVLWSLGRSVNGFTLSPVQEWHRLDWTQDMLPPGWRPLLDRESPDEGDELLDGSTRCWRKIIRGTAPEGLSANATSWHRRTRRPLPATVGSPMDAQTTQEMLASLKKDSAAFAAYEKKQNVEAAAQAPDADGWIRWRGGECPVPRNTLVDIKTRSGERHAMKNAGYWDWNHYTGDPDITAYRVIDSAPAAEPTSEPSASANAVNPAAGAPLTIADVDERIARALEMLSPTVPLNLSVSLNIIIEMLRKEAGK